MIKPLNYYCLISFRIEGQGFTYYISFKGKLPVDCSLPLNLCRALYISEYGLYFCESSFIQNDSMFAEFGTFFCCFIEKCFLCSRN